MKCFIITQATIYRALVMGVVLLAMCVSASAERAQWIWSPSHESGQVPRTAGYFRREFSLPAPESGRITIAADDQYELYLNGRRIGSGESTDIMDRYDVSPYLKKGDNLVAIKVTNIEGSTAALAVKVEVEDGSQGEVSVLSDSQWVTSLSPLPLWYMPVYTDSRWDAAQMLGPLGATPPWDEIEEPMLARSNVARPSPGRVAAEQAPQTPTSEATEPELKERFVVEPVLDGKTTGSLIAMTFNEFGHIVAAREGGELLLIHDSDNDHKVDKVRVYSDQFKSCQGILCLNGQVFVCGNGPDGYAVYCMSDEDHNGTLDKTRTLLKLVGSEGEYGAHGIILGADGMLYVTLGRQAQPVDSYGEDSPLRDYYEGDLVRPRYEDPDGHAQEIKVPGGAILRMNVDGKNLQLVAGGLGNAYDLALDREGQLFTHDSDMESALGAPWERPTSVYHVVPGAEFGWRSGWAKWPEYFVDRLPATLQTGRTAPTGLAFYNHLVFPEEYRNALFISDWSHGRIHGVKLKPDGCSYSANSELFVDDPSLHVTDMAVGPDGALYFTTGGRGMDGGLYRIRWAGRLPAGINNIGEGITAAIRQPQLDAAWSRQKLASIKTEMGAEWNRSVPGVALSSANPWYYRTRALSLLQLFGPAPSSDLLIRLSVTENERVRAKAASLMGLHADSETREALISMLEDADPVVRRVACESLVRAGQMSPVGPLKPLLKSDDRFEAWAARRVLEHMPVGSWKDELVTSDDHRLVIQGSLALMKSAPSRANAMLVLDHLTQLMREFVTDRDFIDMLRIIQVAMIQGEIGPDDVPELRAQLATEFPSGDDMMNRELVRLLTHLQVTSTMDQYLKQLQSDSVPEIEKLHLAMHLRFLADGWNVGNRIQVLEFFETVHKHHGEEVFGQYVTRASRDFAKMLSDEEVREMLVIGADWPHAAMALLYRMPEHLDNETREALVQLDEQLLPQTDLPSMRLKVGIVAVLARSGDPQSLARLREIWEQDPERRPAAALGLAQWPSEENWSFLVRSLPVVEGNTAREVMRQLTLIDLAPEEPEHYRRVILHGLDLGDSGAETALALLDHWIGDHISDGGDWKSQLTAWQDKYAEMWPDHLPAQPLTIREDSKWKYDELLDKVTGSKASIGSVESGAEVFTRAGCVNCHRFGDQGDDTAPELTAVGKRLMKKQVLRAMLHPSHTVAEQYLQNAALILKKRDEASTDDSVAATGSEMGVSDTPPVSPMPEGLLDELTLEQVVDLFTYLTTTPSLTLAEQPDDEQLR